MNEPCVVVIGEEAAVLEPLRGALWSHGVVLHHFPGVEAAWRHLRFHGASVVAVHWGAPAVSSLEAWCGRTQRTRLLLLACAGETPTQPANPSTHVLCGWSSQFVETVRQIVADVPPMPCAGMHQLVTRAPEPVVTSVVLQRIFDLARTAAQSEVTILLLGESGSGKEVVVDQIHRHSRRAQAPLIKVNCGALPDTLMDSELFGHERGAFTGADRRRIGRFEQADGGTLFLDEIGDLPSPLQVKLLRVLQERVIERVGGSGPIPVDIRLVCATHRNLRNMMSQGRFREDLYYRINVLPIRVPPLRERPEDIEPLALRFLAEIHRRQNRGPLRISDAALGALRACRWTGNVRQLRNAMEYASVVAQQAVVQLDDLPEEVRELISETWGARTGQVALPLPLSLAAAVPDEPRRAVPVSIPRSSNCSDSPLSLDAVLQEAECRTIRAALERHGWRVTEVAKELKISRSRLYERMKFFAIERPVKH